MEVSIKVGKVNSNIKINSAVNNDLNINEYLDSSNYIANNSSINYNNEVEDYVFDDVVGDVTYSPYSNNSLLEYSENLLEILQDDINSHLRDNIFYRLEDNANNGDWFSSMITGMFPFIHDFADDTCEFYINNNMRVSVVGEHIEIFDASTGRRFYYEDGFCTEVHFQNGVVGSLSYDENGNYTGISYSYNGNPLSIFDDYNMAVGQYGARQGAFSEADQLLQDPLILEIMHRSFPDATLEDYELYFAALNSVGCGYVAFINLIFDNYQGREDEFLDTFGFPMYTVDDYGNVDYNYEYLVLELFNYVWADQGYSIQELYGNISTDATDEAISGISAENTVDGTHSDIYTDSFENPYRSTFTTYNQWLFETYGIQLERDAYLRDDWREVFLPGTPEWENRLEELRISFMDPNQILYGPPDTERLLEILETNINDGKKIIISAGNFENFNLYDLNGVCHSVGSHAMMVTDIRDGRVYVSSWGNEYYIELSDLGSITSIQVFEFYN